MNLLRKLKISIIADNTFTQEEKAIIDFINNSFKYLLNTNIIDKETFILYYNKITDEFWIYECWYDSLNTDSFTHALLNSKAANHVDIVKFLFQKHISENIYDSDILYIPLSNEIKKMFNLKKSKKLSEEIREDFDNYMTVIKLLNDIESELEKAKGKLDDDYCTS